MEHIADDRAGANNGDLDDDIVKVGGLGFWQECDLGAALDLKHPDRVARLQGFVNFWVVIRNFVKIEVKPVMLAYQHNRITKDGHHSQTQQIDLYDLEPFAIV